MVPDCFVKCCYTGMNLFSGLYDCIFFYMFGMVRRVVDILEFIGWLV